MAVVLTVKRAAAGALLFLLAAGAPARADRSTTSGPAFGVGAGYQSPVRTGVGVTYLFGDLFVPNESHVKPTLNVTLGFKLF